MPAALIHWSIFQFQSFVLVLMRVAPILFLMPVLSSSNLPNLLKMGLALTTSLILLPVVKLDPGLLPQEPYAFGFFLVIELMIGLILGLTVKIIFASLQIGGELVGFQMGMMMANVVDPQSGVNAPVLSQFQYLVGVLLFLSIDGHHWFFRALLQSFSILAPGELLMRVGLYRHLLELSGNMFTIAVQLAAPVMAVLLFTHISLGILAKAVPQVNILMTSFPLTISLGLLFLYFSVEILFPYFQTVIEGTCRGLVSTVLPLMQRVGNG
jgi:flagellar biosynthetic protein FliR